VDILHVQDPPVARIAQAARRLGWIKTKTILAHGTDEQFDDLRTFDYLQHLSPWHLETARDAGFWKPTWTAIPNFVDTSLFHPGLAVPLRADLGLPANSLVLLSTAAIVRRVKRIDYLIREVARLRDEKPGLPVWLVVAGARTSDTEDLIRLGKQLLAEKVRFLVNFPPERMPSLYRLADLFVLCSSKEMMPIALLEATASGLPCLVNRHPVLQWMTGAGGEAIDMAVPGALAAALQNLLREAERRGQLGARARQHCVEHFSRDRVVDQILDYYRFVLTHDRSSRAGRAEVKTAEGCRT
jgi:glycosyltransferase involved in cell wall biosynthesis